MVIADLQKTELLQLCRAVLTSPTLSVAIRKVLDDQQLTAESINRVIRSRIPKTRNFSSRYALLTYWLLRRQRARDFSYDLNLGPRAAEFRRTWGLNAEALVSKEVNPQKQHLVPYSRLKHVYTLEDSARVGNHDINDVGNLTYLSAALNSFDEGIGATPLKLTGEPPPNLAAHSIAGVDEFDRACEENDPLAAKQAYRAFCQARQALLVEGLLAWHEGVAAMATTVPDSQPSPRLVRPRTEDQILGMSFDRSFSDALLAVLRSGFVKVQKKDVDLALAFKVRGEGQVARLDLWVTPSRIELKIADAALAASFSAAVQVQLVVKKGAARYKGPIPFNTEESVRVLNWLSVNVAPRV